MASILVIDDDDSFRRLLTQLLRPVGHVVHEAVDGADGLQALEAGRFDLVLCDLFMPEKDGLEVIREVNRRWPGVKVIAISAGGWGGCLDALPAAELLGATVALHKPFHIQELLTLMETALGRAKPISAGRVEA